MVIQIDVAEREVVLVKDAHVRPMTGVDILEPVPRGDEVEGNGGPGKRNQQIRARVGRFRKERRVTTPNDSIVPTVPAFRVSRRTFLRAAEVAPGVRQRVRDRRGQP